MSRFGQTVRLLREKAGKTLGSLANHLAWTAVYISDIERGRRNPPKTEHIIKMAQFINADPGLLITLAAEENNRIELALDHGRPELTATAALLARSWDGLSKEQLEEIAAVINKSTKSKE